MNAEGQVPIASQESWPQRILRRVAWLVRDRWPTRWVERDVQGVRMAMPWSHRLPDFARLDPAYGENLLQLAAALSRRDTIRVLDVGANIGDSALLMLHRADARVLAIEPDEVYLPFLRHNVGCDKRVVIEPRALTPETSNDGFIVRRVGGTASLTRAESGSAIPLVSVSELRDRHPDFARLRLIKSDTDGHDVALVPAIARIWADVHPVIFFEYDHRASAAAGHNAMMVWNELLDLGYTECAVWDNGGHPLRRCSIVEAREFAARARPSSPTGFWDVAAVHTDDLEARAILDELISSP